MREKGEGIYRSTAGGGRWVRVDDGLPGEVKVLTSVNISTGMAGSTSTGGPPRASCAARTVSEGGRGWAVCPPIGRSMGLRSTPPIPGHVRSYARRAPAMPAPADLKDLAAVAVNPRKPEEVYVSTAEGAIVRRPDGGVTWKRPTG